MYQNNEPVKLQVADQSEEISLKFSVQETAAYGRKSGRKSVHKGGHARILSVCPNKKDKQKHTKKLQWNLALRPPR